ncbi:sporozoite surface protein 2-like [Penaeus vannamei]|uniref:sporozoite surface protein 2-like n=1 Tax=Penaeus vannamei TaxID=6689 RepID=UPI00387F43A4
MPSEKCVTLVSLLLNATPHRWLCQCSATKESFTRILLYSKVEGEEEQRTRHRKKTDMLRAMYDTTQELPTEEKLFVVLDVNRIPCIDPKTELLGTPKCPTLPKHEPTSRQRAKPELMRSEESQPRKLMRSEASQSHKLMRSEASQPRKLMRSEESQPRKPMRSEESQPRKLMRSEESQPRKLVRSEESQPHKLVRSEESQPRKLMRSEESQPRKPMRSEESQPRKPMRSEASQPQKTNEE